MTLELPPEDGEMGRTIQLNNASGIFVKTDFCAPHQFQSAYLLFFGKDIKYDYSVIFINSL